LGVRDEAALTSVGLERIGTDGDRPPYLILPPAYRCRLGEVDQPALPLPPGREVHPARRILQEVAVLRGFLVVRGLGLRNLPDQLGFRCLDRLLVDEGREPETKFEALVVDVLDHRLRIRE